jgi:replication-associated recombination protein RarA
MDEYLEYHDTGKFPVSYHYFETYITLLDKEYYEPTEENTESQIQTAIDDAQTIIN